MQPVNLSVRQEDSSGGLLRVGDWVNVFMTSLVTGPGLKDSPRQVLIVPNARVILKRNTLRPIYAALPSDKPVPFTIETNAYRTALCEFARDKGDFSLVAIPEVEGQRLEAARKNAIEVSKSSDTSSPELHLVAFTDPKSDSYNKELRIVNKYEQTAAPISNVSLQELFNLTIPPPLPPQPGPRPNTVIQQFAGTHRLADVVVAADNRVLGRNDRGLGGRERGPGVVNTNLGSYMDYDDDNYNGDVYDERPYAWNDRTRGRGSGRDEIVFTEFIFRKPSLVSDTFAANQPLPEAPKSVARPR